MAINEQASRDATSKAPVLVYSVNQDGWPASSPIAPPPPPRLSGTGTQVLVPTADGLDYRSRTGLDYSGNRTKHEPLTIYM